MSTEPLTRGGRILLVEDEQDMAFLLDTNLSQQGYQVAVAGTVAEARSKIAAGAPDLLLLDVGLPDGNGFDLLRELRSEGIWAPAMFLTARTDEADRLLGFAVGGDDYVCKPFSMAELIARAGAIIRRSRARSESAEGEGSYAGDGFRVDFDRYRLFRDGEEIALTYLESELLRYLIEHRGEAVSRTELLNKIWGYESFPTTRTVDTHVHGLRRKLEPDSKRPRHILTVHGVGYKFVD